MGKIGEKDTMKIWINVDDDETDNYNVIDINSDEDREGTEETGDFEGQFSSFSEGQEKQKNAAKIVAHTLLSWLVDLLLMCLVWISFTSNTGWKKGCWLMK